MKNAILATGAALLIAVLLSSPTFAQTSNARTVNAAPAPVADEAPAADAPLDELILEAMTPEDRAMLIRRCAGPPPRPLPAETASPLPASEPAIIAAN
ncbi:MAG: hypothetical protein Q8R82_01030 [Hyphomonadaceae bacterium]|nr:hypothetical protein [Hyphomonadaceae bacterium]